MGDKSRNEQAEHPILFSGEMVRAILEGRKTQTRRVVKLQPHELVTSFFNLGLHGWKPTWQMREFSGAIGGQDHKAAREEWEAVAFGRANEPIPCPYGVPGDRLWVREAFGIWQRGDAMPGIGQPYDPVTEYRADGENPDIPHDFLWEPFRWKHSIHMPRWASRLTLEVVDVRVERLQEIAEGDARAEGLSESDARWSDGFVEPHRDQFARFWDSLNAKRGYGWDVNPWVWVISFNHDEYPGGGGP